MKKVVGAIFILVILFFVSCGKKNVAGGKVLKLAHNLSEDHPVHLALVKFGELLSEETKGKVNVQIFPNGVLGNEKETIEQLQNGSLDFTKVSASTLTNFSDLYNILLLPYIFTSEAKYREIMGSTIVEEIYISTKDKGMEGLTYYSSGARSFYTKNKSILKPSDLKGLKIRVQNDKVSIKMIQLLGGAPTPMPYGDVYTALQQGVIDGAESNETVLTIGKHGEVAKYFSLNEHTRVPDILLVSEKTLNGLSDEEKVALKKAATESSKYFLTLWDKAIQESVKEAKEKQKVAFNEVDKTPFIKLTAPMIDEAKKDPKKKSIIDKIQDMQK